MHKSEIIIKKLPNIDEYAVYSDNMKVHPITSKRLWTRIFSTEVFSSRKKAEEYIHKYFKAPDDSTWTSTR
jgi:hypothetical protein